MVKLGKNKLKKLNKLAKRQTATATNHSPNTPNNKIIKKRLNVEKKVTFQKEVLLKETVKSETLVKNLSKTDIALRNLFKAPEKSKVVAVEEKKCKIKAVEKQKRRQKTQINDTELLLNLMKKS